jgi:hypothetical protein
MPMTAAGMEWARGLVDLKGVARPSPFTGRDADWSEWKYRFMAVMHLMNAELAENMIWATSQPDPISYDALSELGKSKTALLYNVLLQLLSGRAFAILRGVDRALRTGGMAPVSP